MKPWASPVLVAALVVASPSTGSAQIHLRPGEYEIAVQISAGGVPTEEQRFLEDIMKNTKLNRVCKTADQVGDVNTIVRGMVEEGKDVGCKISDVKTAGNKMTFTSTCLEDGQSLSGNIEMTFGRDSWTAVSTGKDSLGRTTTVKSSAKRIGECKE
jgi:hypothetical protein